MICNSNDIRRLRDKLGIINSIVYSLIKIISIGCQTHQRYRGRYHIRVIYSAMTDVVDHHGHTADRSKTGRWPAAIFIIGVEIAERAAYYGISLNLITYLTGHLNQSTASAAAAINVWSGVASMLPLLGGFLADSYIGRYRMIVISSALYVLGLGLLTLSSSLKNLHSHSQLVFFYCSLYFVAFAQGGHKPCVQAFGADQFDESDPNENKSRGSFFNWWYFGMTMGTMASVLILSYVQDNISWAIGFGIPCILMVIALVLFLTGTKKYRYCLLGKENPLARVGKSFSALIRSWASKSRNQNISEQNEDADVVNAELICEAKEILRLIPIWLSCLIYATAFAQSSTLFVKQGSTLDRRIGSKFKVSPAALQCFISVAIVIVVPIYDRIIVPTARRFTGLTSGLSFLQRIGIGMFVSTIALVVAALVETKRLKTAIKYGLVDQPKAPIPMTLWWLAPQYLLYGIADVFTVVGIQEFFYDQVPEGLRSLGLALFLSVFGVGSFISSFLVSVINKSTGKSGQSWFSSNLNRAHIDYFYWVLAGLSGVGVIIYLFLASAYVYKKKQK